MKIDETALRVTGSCCGDPVLEVCEGADQPMIIMRLLSTGRAPTEDEIRERIMPLQRPCSTSGTE